jgi:hypothetical protein
VIFWAYGIVPSETPVPESLVGLGGAPIELVPAGRVALAGSHLPHAPPPELPGIRAHDAVVRTLADGLGAVRPIRFGACAAGPDALARSLARDSERHAEALAHVRGAVQVTVRIASAVGPREAPDDDARGPGTSFLRARARVLSPSIPGWADARRAVAEHVREERIEAGDPRIERWRVYHLVPRHSVQPHREALAALRGRGWVLAIGEPAPPWAFGPASALPDVLSALGTTVAP